MIESIPKFVQGAFLFEGQGMAKPRPIDASLTYTVPPDKRAQLIYLRAGNSTKGLVYLVIMRNGEPMRYFPIGARAAMHVPLAVTEDVFPESKLELWIAAPKGVEGTVVVDMGLHEV